MLESLYDGGDLNVPKMTQNWVIKGIQGVSLSTDARAYVVSANLDKSHTMTFVSGYDVRVRKRVVDRWLVLEAKVAAPAGKIRVFTAHLTGARQNSVWQNSVLWGISPQGNLLIHRLGLPRASASATRRLPLRPTQRRL